MTQLLLLEDLMAKLKKELNLTDTPKPCDYFDLIGGAGAGG